MDKYKATEKMLWEYTSYKAYLDNAMAELMELDIDSGDGMGIDYSNPKLSRSYNFSSTTENGAIKKIEWKDLLKQRIELTISKLNRLERALQALTDTERIIIEQYYFRDKRYYDITYQVQYSERQCRRKKKHAVEKIKIALYGDDTAKMAI